MIENTRSLETSHSRLDCIHCIIIERITRNAPGLQNKWSAAVGKDEV